MSRRVVVTGMGVFSPLGTDLETFADGLFNGQCAIKPQTYAYDDDLSLTLPAAAIEGADETLAALGRDMTRADPYSQFGVAAAEMAIAHSGITFDDALRTRTATLLGTGIGGQQSSDDTHYNMLRKGRRPHPLTILRTIPNALSSHISIRHGLTGPSFAIASACASGAHAIGMAADMIRNGHADAAITGASEKGLTYGALEAWRAMHILSSDICRPFSKTRNGLVIGEGAAVLVLEEYENARARGANIHAELTGFGLNADGNDMINPSTQGAAGAMRLALRDITIADPAQVYINAHGTGTLLNDPTETAAIRAVFGSDADDLIVSSTKSMHGHLLGAAGGLEAVAAICALKAGQIPPTINLDEPDPACDLDYAASGTVTRPINLALSNSFAFGGQNAVLAFEPV
ncbi:MAG: beta-ketoacyl-[acyl-carrier-protein] synthase family protein [Pseudomonadota bacterium]